MVLAQRQKYRSRKQNRKPRDEPTCLCPDHFLPFVRFFAFQRTNQNKAQGTIFLQDLPNPKSGDFSYSCSTTLPQIQLTLGFSKCGSQTLVPCFHYNTKRLFAFHWWWKSSGCKPAVPIKANYSSILHHHKLTVKERKKKNCQFYLRMLLMLQWKSLMLTLKYLSL